LAAHHLLTALAACAFAGLAGCADAAAAATIGSDLSGAPNSACTSATGCTAATLSSGGARALTAPSNGVVVRFRIRHGPTPPGASYTMKVLSGSGAIVGGLTSFALAAQAPPNQFDDFVSGGVDTVATVDAAGRPRGVPISSGQRIGVFAPGGVAFETTAAGSVLAERNGDHAGGAAAYALHAGFEVLINADVEPDADGDGYGDQSQDNCATAANDQSSNPCGNRPRPRPAPAVVPTRVPADYVKPRIGRLVRPRRPLSSLSRQGVSVPVACYESCSARGTLMIRRGSGGPVTVGRGRRRSVSGGRFRLRLKLTRKGKRVLRRSRRNVRLRLRVSAADRWGRSSREQRLVAIVVDTGRGER
jgi:hypothetical protein